MASILKSFLVSLAAFIGISAVFGILQMVLEGTIADIASDPFSIIVLLFHAITKSLFIAVYTLSQSVIGLVEILTSAGDIVAGFSSLLGALGIFLAPLVAAFLAGKLAESKGAAIGGFILALVVSWLVWSIFYILGDLGILSVGSAATSYSSEALYLNIFLTGSYVSSVDFWYAMIIMIAGTLITAFSWGFLALAAQKESFY